MLANLPPQAYTYLNDKVYSVVTIKEIARLTNVSAATVSNVLNGKAGAASEAKAREIADVARNLHYMPNMLARNLQQQKTNTVGIITEDLTVFNTPEIVDGIDAFCEENGYGIILENMRLFKRYKNDFTDTPKHQELLDSMLKNLGAKQVEGIIYVGYHCREIAFLPSRVQVPFVYAYCYPREEIYPAVMYDDEKAAADVTRLLVCRGHKNIGVICGPASSYHTQARLKGFKAAMAEHGFKAGSDCIVYGDWERPSGYRLAALLLDRGVSAIFSFNDLMASGVYQQASERGLQIGKDISLFGFDNRDISQGYIPALSTVEPPLHQIGRRCAEIVFSQIKRRKTGRKRIYLPCTILERRSVAAPGM
ncbi:MAG: LacI family DNA-binding transcriptional regulator [Treponema sp.]|nr:LacI family DNA-binding transcriptional regulator [Treponema sp.]